MKLSFDKAATRKLELWAIHNNISVDVERDSKDIAKDISRLIMTVVDGELSALKPVQIPTPTQPEKGSVGA